MAQSVTTVTEGENGKAVKIRAGDILVVRLSENATTGYRWALDGVDSPLVTIHEAQYSSPSPSVGGSGEVTWRVEGKAPGSLEIKLKLWRSWEGEKSVQKRFRLALTIGA
jgi:inhibitor of cysteine peptidase